MKAFAGEMKIASGFHFNPVLLRIVPQASEPGNPRMIGINSYEFAKATLWFKFGPETTRADGI